MAKFFLIYVGLAVYAVALAAPEGRIIGGREVDIAKHPYVVSIRYRKEPDDAYVHKYAGIIYSKRAVITGAQCVVDIKENEKLMVVAGANSRIGLDGLPYPAKKWISHPSYSSWTVDYDVGIIFIDDVFDFNHLKINPIAIIESRPVDNKICTAAGWGYREEFGPSSQNLEEVHVPIVSTADCKKSYGVSDITERMICAGYLTAGGKDACQGDAGGPLVIDGQLVGLISWGRGCARPGFPSVYTFLSPLKQWIDETIAANI